MQTMMTTRATFGDVQDGAVTWQEGPFTLTAEVDVDPEPDTSYLDDDDDARDLLERGLLEYVAVCVTVYRDGQRVTWDSLCGIEYRSDCRASVKASDDYLTNIIDELADNALIEATR